MSVCNWKLINYTTNETTIKFGNFETMLADHKKYKNTNYSFVEVQNYKKYEQKIYIRFKNIPIDKYKNIYRLIYNFVDAVKTFFINKKFATDYRDFIKKSFIMENKNNMKKTVNFQIIFPVLFEKNQDDGLIRVDLTFFVKSIILYCYRMNKYYINTDDNTYIYKYIDLSVYKDETVFHPIFSLCSEDISDFYHPIDWQNYGINTNFTNYNEADYLIQNSSNCVLKINNETIQKYFKCYDYNEIDYDFNELKKQFKINEERRKIKMKKEKIKAEMFKEIDKLKLAYKQKQKEEIKQIKQSWKNGNKITFEDFKKSKEQKEDKQEDKQRELIKPVDNNDYNDTTKRYKILLLLITMINIICNIFNIKF